MTQSHSSLPVLVVKGVLAGILYVLGSILFGMIGGAFHLGFPSLGPPGVDPQASFRAFLLACPLIGLALVPLALHTAGSRLIRGLALFLLAFISLGPTAVIEMKMFTTFLAHGGALTVVASTFLPTLLSGLGLSYLLKLEPAEPSLNGKIRSFFAAHSPASWAGRFVLALVGFVAAFFLFGMMVAPCVVPVYRAGGFGLTLPPISAFLPFEFVRSPLPRRLLPVSTSLESQPRLADFLTRSGFLGPEWPLWPSAISWFSPRLAHRTLVGDRR